MSDCVGIDFGGLADQSHLNIATGILKQPPAFWGRYFKGPGNRMPIQYQPDQEAAFLLREKIPILPIARQTPDVASNDKTLGYAAGLRNAAALIASFGAVHLSQQRNGLVVFLDVETDTPLNAQYYLGWSNGVVDGGASSMTDFRDEIEAGGVNSGAKITFIPCVYGHHADDSTWTALQQAMKNGAQCGAAWVVYEDLHPQFPIGPWSSDFTNQNMPPTLPIVLCQRVLDYNSDGGFDFDLVNPASKDWLLQRLILPEQMPSIKNGKGVA